MLPLGWIRHASVVMPMARLNVLLWFLGVVGSLLVTAHLAMPMCILAVFLLLGDVFLDGLLLHRLLPDAFLHL